MGPKSEPWGTPQYMKLIWIWKNQGVQKKVYQEALKQSPWGSTKNANGVANPARINLKKDFDNFKTKTDPLISKMNISNFIFFSH